MSAPELHHVGVVVRDIDAALSFYRDRLGLSAREVRDLPSERVRVAFLPLANCLLELVQPLDAESGAGRYLASRGDSALHHVCLAVDGLAETLDRLARAGVELIDAVPRRGAQGDVAFLHPRAANGVLVELLDRGSVGRT